MDAIKAFFNESFDFLQLSLQLRSIQFWDILDILIMWLLIYNLLKLIHGTRAMQMAMGIVALFVIQVAADFLRMTVLSKVVSSLFTIIPIAIIVLFENEIRKVLASLGRGPFVGLTQSSSDPDLDQIFFAVRYLAERNIGALIVFERTEGLKNYIEIGTVLDSVPSSELLLNIFYSKSNLHDGAVIISQDRIASASSVLPLSNRVDLPRHFGTRHRAAVGISEETDCVVVVVSEESGRITFVKNGEAFVPEDYSIAQLKNLFHELTQHVEEDDKSRTTLWRKTLFRRERRKLIASKELTSSEEIETVSEEPEPQKTASGSGP